MILDAIEPLGFRLEDLLPSKFDWLFGSSTARVAIFQGRIDRTQMWVDVHILRTPVEGITACAATDGSGQFTVRVKGRPQVYGSGNVTGSLSSGRMFFAMNDRLFVMTPDPRLRDALRSALQLSVPDC